MNCIILSAIVGGSPAAGATARRLGLAGSTARRAAEPQIYVWPDGQSSAFRRNHSRIIHIFDRDKLPPASWLRNEQR
jgi:hypothetical protein